MEEKKRLYYVAFTRAKNSLSFVLSHGTTPSARIVSDYNLISVPLLTNPASGNDVDDDGENHAVDAIVVDEDDKHLMPLRMQSTRTQLRSLYCSVLTPTDAANVVTPYFLIIKQCHQWSGL